jgi:hypothetical protein
MNQGDRFFTFIAVLVVALVLQLFLGYLDTRDTPAKAAVNFTKAYFQLDESMADYLCSELTAEEDVDLVKTYIEHVADEARIVGFDLNYMRKKLFSVHTEMITQSESEAEIRITAQGKRNINPVFTLIAKLFFIGETYHIDETLKVIKEDGNWKVCGKVFLLAV